MTTTKPFQLGSVSTGTLRTEDLFTPLIAKLREFNPHHHLVQKWDVFVLNDSDAEIMGQLAEALQAYCPPFVYFGAHPDDPSDFGFFPDWDAIDDATHYLSQREGEYKLTYDLVIRIYDHGNVTVMTLDRNVLWTTV